MSLAIPPQFQGHIHGEFFRAGMISDHARNDPGDSCEVSAKERLDVDVCFFGAGFGDRFG